MVISIEGLIAHNDTKTHRRLFIQSAFSGHGHSFHKELGENKCLMGAAGSNVTTVLRRQVLIKSYQLGF